MTLDDQLHDLADTYRSASDPHPELLGTILERVERRPNRWWRAVPALAAAALLVALVAALDLDDGGSPVATGTLTRAQWIEAAEPVCSTMVTATVDVEPRFLTAEAYTLAGEAFLLAAEQGDVLLALDLPEDDPDLPARLAERLAEAREHVEETLLLARDGYLTAAAQEFDLAETRVDDVIAELKAFGVSCTAPTDGD